MSDFEDLGRAWAARAAAVEVARAERDAADREFADVLERSFDVTLTDVDRQRGRKAVEVRAAAAEKVRDAGRHEAAAHLALLNAAMELPR